MDPVSLPSCIERGTDGAAALERFDRGIAELVKREYTVCVLIFPEDPEEPLYGCAGPIAIQGRQSKHLGTILPWLEMAAAALPIPVQHEIIRTAITLQRAIASTGGCYWVSIAVAKLGENEGEEKILWHDTCHTSRLGRRNPAFELATLTRLVRARIGSSAGS